MYTRESYPFHRDDYRRAGSGEGYKPAPMRKPRSSNWQVMRDIAACCFVSSGIALVLLAYFYA